ncbi:hypothetical protein HNR46_004152 [Haloferula luteola]|uniref:Uncharacterized protein n=1 Tax=Haloferula luteola TaxID=595692 RepID=A0A840VH20_9BACT|nr:hypothetical protein [Haloferula luteola]
MEAGYFSEFGAFEGDLSLDSAKDELDSIIEGIVKRNDELVAHSGFNSIDVPGVRANVVILALLLINFGGH